MAALTAATTERLHIIGDLQFLRFTFTGLNDADTFSLPGLPKKVLLALFVPTTAQYAGTSTTNGVITFSTSANGLAGTLVVIVAG